MTLLEFTALWFGIGLILRIAIAVSEKIDGRELDEGYEQFLKPLTLLMGPIFLISIIVLYIGNGMGNKK